MTVKHKLTFPNQKNPKKVSHANSRPYDRALSIMSSGRRTICKYKAAEVYLLAAQRAGDMRATYALGTWHLHGGYFPKDINRGLAMIKCAAEAFVPSAMHDIGYAYESGVMPSDNPMHDAYRFYLLAAVAGDESSQQDLARCICYGVGIQADQIVGIQLEKFIRFRRRQRKKQSAKADVLGNKRGRNKENESILPEKGECKTRFMRKS